jgi:hypothetical protein
MYIATLKGKLDRAGAKPAFDPKRIGARFYHIGDAAKFPRGRLTPMTPSTEAVPSPCLLVGNNRGSK